MFAIAAFQAIATSSSKEAVRIKRQNHGELFGRMECVVTGDDPEVHGLFSAAWSPSFLPFRSHPTAIDSNPCRMNLHKYYWCGLCGGVEQVLLHLTPLTLPPLLFNRRSSRSCYPLAFTEANIVPLPHAHTTTLLSYYSYLLLPVGLVFSFFRKCRSLHTRDDVFRVFVEST